jgi:tRNA(Ile2) C34 agmatinyltransferase TiaS
LTMVKKPAVATKGSKKENPFAKKGDKKEMPKKADKGKGKCPDCGGKMGKDGKCMKCGY